MLVALLMGMLSISADDIMSIEGVRGMEQNRLVWGRLITLSPGRRLQPSHLPKINVASFRRAGWI